VALSEPTRELERSARAEELVEALLEGDRRALARTLTHVENGTETGQAALSLLFPRAGNAHLVGVTGSPGTGKSTLVNHLTLHYRQRREGYRPKRVAVVAVDPSSPFSGGAVLGDRVRMRDLSGDPDVFIRSMANRGALGGLARSTAAVVQVLDAAGYELIFIETVGAGQSEVDVARLAHTTLVVEAPGLGDDIQAIKAGILEIADVLVINKADRPGVENTERALHSMLELARPSMNLFRDPHCAEPEGTPAISMLEGEPARGWKPPILRTVAIFKTGVEAVAAAIDEHRAYLRETGEWKRRERARIRAEVDALLQAMLVSRWRETVAPERLERVLARLMDREISPNQAVELLLSDDMRGIGR